MGTTSDKLTYLNGTKQALKDSINNIGGSITNETTFRAYAEELDNIYDNLPKTTGEGSNLSLSTLKGRINVDDIKGDTEQDGTPTPDSPQDIEVVTGQQEVVVSNRNLLEGIELGDINSQTGAETSAIGTVRSTNFMPYQLDTKYYGSVNGAKLSSGLNLRFYNKDKEYIGYSSSTLKGAMNFNIVITTSAVDTTPRYFKFRCQFNTGVITSIDDKVLISTTNDYSYVEHQEQTKTLHLGDIELCKIGTYQDRIYKNNDKWYIEKKIGHKKASEITTNDIGGTGGSQSVYFTSSFTNVMANRTLQVYSNVQTWKNSVDTEWNLLNGNYIGVLFNVQQIYINKTASTKSELITWLNSINFEMYYVLATPTYEEITNETLLQELESLEKLYSYNGVTNITTTSDTGCDIILSVSALKGA